MTYPTTAARRRHTDSVGRRMRRSVRVELPSLEPCVGRTRTYVSVTTWDCLSPISSANARSTVWPGVDTRMGAEYTGEARVGTEPSSV